jgi:hypothetical protein
MLRRRSERVFEPQDPAPRYRSKPFVGGTLAPDVVEALRAEHARRGGAFSHVLEEVLRAGLGFIGAATANATNPNA